MTAEALIEELEKKGVELWAEKGQLRYRAPKGVMDKSILNRLSNKKNELITLVDNQKNSNKYEVIIPDPENRYEPFPLTDVQHAYLVGRTNAYELGGVSTHFYFEMDVKEINIKDLNKAWQSLIESHEMLRLIFTDDGKQRILEKAPEYNFKVYDFISSLNKKNNLLSIRNEMSHQVMPSNKWPFFDIRIAKKTESEMRLFVGFDCLIGDASSQLKILDQWVDVYKNPTKKFFENKLSFRDYMLGVADLKKTEIYRRSKNYWLNKIDKIQPGPSLPLRFSSHKLRKSSFVRHAFEITEVKLGEFKKKASRNKLTLSSVILSAFCHVIGYWSRDKQFTINTTLFNRLPLHPEVKNILGEFTSLDLLSINLMNKKTFIEKTREIQKQLMLDLDHIHFSGVEVIQELERRRGFKPGSFPVVFTGVVGGVKSRKDPSGFFFFGDVNYVISQTPQIWLDCQAVEYGGSMRISWDSVAGLFPDGLIEKMFTAYRKFLDYLNSENSDWNKSIPEFVLNEQISEKGSLSNLENKFYDETLFSLFEKQVIKTPENKAIITSDYSISYENLLKLSDNLGQTIHQKGVKPGELVAIIMEKGWEQVAAVLGILKAGAAYLPVDPDLPSERMEIILTNGEVNKVITQSWLMEKLDISSEIEILCLDRIEKIEEDYKFPSNLQNPQSLAYVIYTSGSTGVPKGVMIDHRGAVNTILDINERFKVSEKDRILGLSNLNFDLSVYDIFGSLSSGAALVLPDHKLQKDPGHWVELMKKEKVSIWNSVPMFMQMLVEYSTGQNLDVPLSLRLSLLSGDWIPLNLPEKIKKLFENIELLSLGGATEASIWSVLYPVEEVDPNWKSIPYGKPMKNQKVYVLDKNLDICPDWVTGDIYIGGVGLAKGYWKDKQKTENSFIIKNSSGESLYKTGDLGRYLPDGNIEFLGREDFQVKVNGYRIELREIEEIVKDYPKVNFCVADVFGKKDAAKKIIIYVVADEEDDLKLSLIEFLKNKLPSYMLPEIIVPLKKVPLSNNGKVDRKKLPDPFKQRKLFFDDFVEPKNELEKMLCGLVSDILMLESISTKQKFFDLGASSLDIIKIQSELKNKEKIEISVIDLFEHSSIAKLASFILGKAEKNMDSNIKEKVNARKSAALKKVRRKRIHS